MKLLFIATVCLCWFSCESRSDMCNSDLWKISGLHGLFNGMCGDEDYLIHPGKVDKDPYEQAKSSYLRRPKNFDKRTSDSAKGPSNEVQCQPDCNDEDEMLIKSWSFDYKKLSPDQKMYTKKAIQDILFEGQLGTLRRKSVLINSPDQCSSGTTTKLLAENGAECKKVCKATSGSLPQPNPTTAELPKFPELSKIPEIPKIPEFPKIPELPKMYTKLTTHNIPKLPELPTLPEPTKIPDLPKIPEFPKIPELPKMYTKLTTHNISKLPELPTLPELRKLPEHPKIPALPDMTGTVNMAPDESPSTSAPDEEPPQPEV